MIVLSFVGCRNMLGCLSTLLWLGFNLRRGGVSSSELCCAEGVVICRIEKEGVVICRTATEGADPDGVMLRMSAFDDVPDILNGFLVWTYSGASIDGILVGAREVMCGAFLDGILVDAREVMCRGGSPFARMPISATASSNT